MIGSKYQPTLTIDYMVNEPENKFFDRKSARVKPSDLAPIISAFANAEGGTIVIGIDEKTKEIEGVNACGEERINDLITAPKDHCRPMIDGLDTVNEVWGDFDELLITSKY